MSDNLVVKKNPLVESRYKLSPLEIKILLSVVAMVDKDDSDFWTYQLRVKDLGDYKEIKRSCKTLINRSFEIKEGSDWYLFSWFSYIGYKHKEGIIEFSFDPRLKPYLLQIKDNFTAYTLESVLPMRSVYSIRIYELLKQYEAIGTRVFNLDELQDLLQVPKSYRVWRDFVKRVVEPAKREINSVSDLQIDYSPVKTGRKYTAVSFRIAPNLQKLPLTRYKALVRGKCVGKTLLRTTDKDTGKKIELSVSEKGYLYNKLDPDWKITNSRANDIWSLLQSKGVCLEVKG